MAKISLYSRKCQTGKLSVYISLSHNGETRRISTGLNLDSEKELKDGQIVKRPDANMLNVKLRAKLNKVQSQIDELAYIEGLTCKELIENIKALDITKGRTLESVFDEYINNSGRLKQSSINLYTSLFSSISSFIPSYMLMERITRATVMGYEKHLFTIGNSNATIKAKLNLLSKLISYSKKCGYVQYSIDPISGYKMPVPAVRDIWLTVEEIKAIRDINTNKPAWLKFRDFFMLSYYLGGINIIDLLRINFKVCVDEVTYIRTKTDHTNKVNRDITFSIPDEAKEIINRRVHENGFLDVTPYQRTTNLHWFFRDNVENIARFLGIKRLVYYSARKSFAQHAFNLGVETSVIDYILGHKLGKGGTSLYSYIGVTPQMATEAIRRVLDNLK